MTTLKDLQEQILKDFEEQYPPFKGVGARFPIFNETPVYTHIKQFISRSNQTLLRKVVEDLKELSNKSKTERGLGISLSNYIINLNKEI